MFAYGTISNWMMEGSKQRLIELLCYSESRTLMSKEMLKSRYKDEKSVLEKES